MSVVIVKLVISASFAVCSVQQHHSFDSSINSMPLLMLLLTVLIAGKVQQSKQQQQ